MESAKYSPVAGDDDDDSVLPPSKPINRWRQFRPVLALYLLLSLAVGCYYYHHHYSDRQLGVTKIAVETESPIELLRESCELRFWSRHTQPYCERAIAEDSWLVAANIPPMPPLSVFQLSTPPRVSVKSTDEPQVKECEQQLMQHTFGWSYGKPFVGEYNPPADCKWTNVVFKLSMDSRGRQFDRLGHLFLGDIEVWRTSTAEPVKNGIIFSHVKDMTHLTALLRKPQKIIFEMGNLVDETYTGSFNATLTATYYSPLGISPAHPANLVLPISHQRSDKGQPSHFSLPGQRAISSLELPKNSIRAVVSVSASGNGAEEFWYTNVPNAYTRTFGKNALPGYGPYREIQVLVDGKVAGFVWPFTTIFTGGFVPSLWSPIVAPTAFDLPEYEVDITPFLPQLLSGDGEHTIEFVIFSYDSTTKALSRDLGNDWLVSGRVFVWTDPDEDWVTTGSLLQHDVSQPFFNFLPIIELDSQGNNKSIQLSLSTYNNIAVLSTINTSTGKFSAFWLQGLRYESSTKLLDGGYKQFISTSTAVTETTVAYGTRRYRYSLGLDTAFTPRKDWSGFDVVADINIGINVAGSGKWVDGNRIGDGKMGTQFEGHSTWGSNRAGGGVSSQVWGEVRPPRDEESVGSYARRVDAVGGDLVKDWESINGVEKTVVDYGDYEAVWGPEAEERLEMERLWVV